MFQPSKITSVTAEMRDNLQTVLNSLTLVGAYSDTVDTVLDQTMHDSAPTGFFSHQTAFSLLPGALPPDLAPTLTPILNFAASPLSGILIGELGPFVSPFVALGNSISDGDSFSEILANTVGAFFNGADLNLDPLLPAINGAGLLPAGVSFEHLDIALGGLFSPGDVANGPWELYDSAGNPFLSVPAVGGSMFNALGQTLDAGPLAISTIGHPVGPLAAWQGLSELIGLELGSNLNAKEDPGSFGSPTR
jgi:hypothetical protein